MRTAASNLGRRRDVITTRATRIASGAAAKLRMAPILVSASTKRVLERVPEDSLRWQPHPKSMSLGQLTLHVATLPSLVTQLLSDDTLDFDLVPTEPPTVARHTDLPSLYR